jgi:hypothetical protein
MSTTHSQVVSRRARLEARVPFLPARRDATAHDLLGGEHPLARAEARAHTLVVQSTAVCALAAFVGLAWLVEPDGRYAVALVAAAVVQAGLALALVLATQAKRDAVLRLVAEGRGDLPLAAVARLRRRLLRPTGRERLAGSLDALRREVARPLRGALPLYSRGVVQSVDRELESVARLLRAPAVSPDGVAMTLLLLFSESSALYGDDAEKLRRELGRLTFLLGSAEAHG